MKNSQQESIGERLIRTRNERGLSQQDFADQLKISRDDLRLMELDQLSKFKGLMTSMSKVLGWTHQDLMDMSLKTYATLETAKPKADMTKIIAGLTSEEIPEPYDFIKEIVLLSFDQAGIDIEEEELLDFDLTDFDDDQFWGCIIETFPEFDPVTYKISGNDYNTTAAALIESILITWDGTFPGNVREMGGILFFQ